MSGIMEKLYAHEIHMFKSAERLFEGLSSPYPEIRTRFDTALNKGLGQESHSEIKECLSDLRLLIAIRLPNVCEDKYRGWVRKSDDLFLAIWGKTPEEEEE